MHETVNPITHLACEVKCILIIQGKDEAVRQFALFFGVSTEI